MGDVVNKYYVQYVIPKGITRRKKKTKQKSILKHKLDL